MNVTEVRKCSECKREWPLDEPDESRKFKTCKKCRLHQKQKAQEIKKAYKGFYSIGVRICSKCGKKRQDDEPEEIKEYNTCQSCTENIIRHYEERPNTGVRICVRCQKRRPDDEPLLARRFKWCGGCRQRGRLSSHQHRELQRKNKAELAICQGCRKNILNKDSGIFNYCSECRPLFGFTRDMHDLKKNHHGDQIGKKVGEHTDHAPRPLHDSVFRIEADSARRLSPSSSRNPMYVSSNQHSENTGNQIALPPPIPEQIRAANTLSKAPPGIDNTSNIFLVQSTSEEKSAEFAQKENHFMSSAAEIDLTRTKPLESGMVAPLTDISNIQSQTTKSISKENADTIDERVSELSSFSPRSEAEASSSEDGEYTAGSIEPLTDNSNFSQSIFLDRMEPDLELQSEYREHLEKEGPMSFLERYIPDTMNKFDICKMIINLGYPKESIEDCQHLTINETIKVLIDLISKDLSQDSDSDMVIDVPSEDEDNYNIKDLLQDLRRSSRIVVITGAGISTSLGIPDFRSFQGLYTQLSRLNVEDPQKVFDMETFKKDPRIFYSIAHMVLPPDKNYSIMHAFLNLLQNKNKLLRNYTQNIDNLEARAGIEHKKLIQCHGSFTHATCITCLSQYSGRKIERHIRHQQIPRCARCWKNTGEAPMNHGVIKPDITFFGEDLPKRYYSTLSRDVRSCDLVLVVGTSLKVEPVASIIDKIPRRVPRILINKDAIPDKDFDLSLLGYCDEVVSYLAKELGDEWNIDHQLYDQETNFEVREDPNFESVYSISKKS